MEAQGSGDAPRFDPAAAPGKGAVLGAARYLTKRAARGDPRHHRSERFGEELAAADPRRDLTADNWHRRDRWALRSAARARGGIPPECHGTTERVRQCAVYGAVEGR